MSEETPRKRRKRQRDPNSATCCGDSVLIVFVDKAPLPGSPEYQERMQRRLSELGPDAPFIVDESKRPTGEQPPYTEYTKTFFEFTDHGDAPLDHTRERKGRPERSPSLPPLDQPKPEEPKPGA